MATLAETTLYLNNATLSYPHLFEKQSPIGVSAEPAYSAEFIVDPVKNPQAFAAMQKAFQDCVIAAGKADHMSFLKPPWRTGEQYNAELQSKGKEPREEIVGKVVIKAKDTKYAPTVVSRTNQPIRAEQQDQVFGGCLVNAVITLYYTNNPINPGVNGSLVGIQVIDNVNVTPLGGSGKSRRPEDLFSALPPLQGTPTGGPKQEETPEWM